MLRGKLIKQLLLSNDMFHIEYSGYLSNHLTHAITALDRLGASDRRITEFAEKYKLGLERAINTSSCSLVKVNRDNWDSFKGKNRNYTDLVDFFRREIHALGRMNALSAYFPSLIPSVPCAAFHGTIQLGYGVLANEDDIVATGLAYLTLRNKNFGPLWLDPPEHGPRDPAEILNAVREDKRFDSFDWINVSGFQNRVLALHDDEDFRNAVREHAGCYTKLDVPSVIPRTVAEMLKSFVVLYHSTRCRGFFTLHLITSLYALNAVLPLLDENMAMEALKYLWQGAVFAYVATERTPLIADIPKTTSTTWEQVIEKVVAQDDEHVIKICDALNTFAKDKVHFDSEEDQAMLLEAANLSLHGDWDFIK